MSVGGFRLKWPKLLTNQAAQSAILSKRYCATYNLDNVKEMELVLLQPDGYLAMPASGHGDPVLVLHAWWGLNDTIKAFCSRLAQAGFVVFAPDLYHGNVGVTIAEAGALGHALEVNHLQAKSEVVTAARFLNERAGSPSGRGMAVIGFSLGAYYAADLALTDAEHTRSVVLFYGTGDGDVSISKAAYIGHFAEHDEYEPHAYAEAMEAALQRAGRAVTFYRYPGTGHWFFEPDRTHEYDSAAAELAWDRTLAFLERDA